MQQIHILIPTHTNRHLPVVLAGLSVQRCRPASVTVSCDTDEPAIGQVLQQWAPRLGTPVWWVRRPSMGNERLCQVRNNGVRAIVEQQLGGACEADHPALAGQRLLVLDGDMLAPPELVGLHAASGRPLTYAYRVNLSEPRTAALDAEGLVQGNGWPELTAEHTQALARRDRRYRRHALLGRLGLGPRHKPKLLGGHFSCDLGLYVRLNGFDELYQGWGFKDDEFAERAARLGAAVDIAVARIPAWHLWHPTRQPDVPMRELPTARRFAQRHHLPTCCDHGLRTPLEQGEVRIGRLA